MDQLSVIITQHENQNPGSISIVLGDFNHTNLRKGLPKYHQHVNCMTRHDKIIDHCYTTTKGDYRALKRAPLGNSDHNMVHLVPAYRQQLKCEKPTVRLVSQWTEAATQRLQGCLMHAQTGICLLRVRLCDLDECTEVTLDYIKFCEELCIPKKAVKRFPNDKPWFNWSVRNSFMPKK